MTYLLSDVDDRAEFADKKKNTSKLSRLRNAVADDARSIRRGARIGGALGAVTSVIPGARLAGRVGGQIGRTGMGAAKGILGTTRRAAYLGAKIAGTGRVYAGVGVGAAKGAGRAARKAARRRLGNRKKSSSAKYSSGLSLLTLSGGARSEFAKRQSSSAPQTRGQAARQGFKKWAKRGALASATLLGAKLALSPKARRTLRAAGPGKALLGSGIGLGLDSALVGGVGATVAASRYRSDRKKRR